MRTATLAALVMAGIVAILGMALWPEPRLEYTPIVDVAPAPVAFVAPGGRTLRHSARDPSYVVEIPGPLEQIGSRPIAATAAAGMTTDVAPGAATATMDRGPSTLLELVTIIPQPGVPSKVALTPTQAIDAVMSSPDYQETVSPLARLYFATFGRYPDYEGLNYYTGQREGGSGLPEIAEEFARGREFDMRYGDLSNAEFVARIISNVLGNESQADVRAHWTRELDAGRMTRGQVIVDLAESGMFRERTANQVFVSAAYAEVLRAAPAPGDFSRWVTFLDAGNPQRAMIDGLLARR